MIDTRNNYDVDYKMDFKNLNTYEEKLEKAKRYVKIRKKIEKIQEKLEEEIENEQIEEKIKVVDFLLNLSYEKQIITEKKYYKFGNKLDDIIKYTIGWIKSLN